VGGGGADTLTGGAGADWFRVGAFKVSPDQLIGTVLPPGALEATGPDVITDFDPSEDVIDVSVMVAQAIYDSVITLPQDIAQYLAFHQVDPGVAQAPLGVVTASLVLDFFSLGGETEVLALLWNQDAGQLNALRANVLQYEAPTVSG